MANSDLKLRTKDYALFSDLAFCFIAKIYRLGGHLVDWGQIFTIDIIVPGVLEEQYGTTVKDFVCRCSLSRDPKSNF